MKEKIQFAIIGDKDCGIAQSLSSMAAEKGYGCIILSHEQATTYFTLSRINSSFSVEPDMPLLVLPSVKNPRTDDISDLDDIFLRGEIGAFVWAIASWMKSPVINRPPKRGIYSALTGLSSIDELRAGAASREEMYASGAEQLADQENLWVECWPSKTTLLQGDPKYFTSTGPLRARPGFFHFHYKMIYVVGTSAWCIKKGCSDSRNNELTLSIQYAQALGLDFCSFLWAHCESDSKTSLVKIIASPQDLANRAVEDTVLQALLTELTK